MAAAYMNICIVHIQGGEVSGSIDESARHAITKFAHYHFPSTQRSAEYLLRMGENPASILGVGLPLERYRVRAGRRASRTTWSTPRAAARASISAGPSSS